MLHLCPSVKFQHLNPSNKLQKVLFHAVKKMHWLPVPSFCLGAAWREELLSGRAPTPNCS